MYLCRNSSEGERIKQASYHPRTFFISGFLDCDYTALSLGFHLVFWGLAVSMYVEAAFLFCSGFCK